MQMQFTKNPGRFELGTILSWPIRSIVCESNLVEDEFSDMTPTLLSCLWHRHYQCVRLLLAAGLLAIQSVVSIIPYGRIGHIQCAHME